MVEFVTSDKEWVNHELIYKKNEMNDETKDVKNPHKSKKDSEYIIGENNLISKPYNYIDEIEDKQELSYYEKFKIKEDKIIYNKDSNKLILLDDNDSIDNEN